MAQTAECCRCLILDAGKTDADAGVAAEAVVIAEIKQGLTIAESALATSAGIKIVARSRPRSRGIKGALVNRCALVAKLAFEPQHAEIIAGDEIDVDIRYRE